MSPQQKLIAYWQFLERIGEQPSMNSVLAWGRHKGLKYRNEDARNWLRAFSGRAPGAPEQNAGRSFPEGGAQFAEKRGAPGARLRARNKVSLVTKYSDTSYLPGLVDPAPTTAKKPTKTTEPAAWIEPLRESVRAILAVPLPKLTTEQRLALGRYHALTFGYCSRSERTNRAKGVQVAAQLALMAADKHFADLTVDAYLGEADACHEQLGKVPWFKPFLIRAVEEFEA